MPGDVCGGRRYWVGASGGSWVAVSNAGADDSEEDAGLGFASRRASSVLRRLDNSSDEEACAELTSADKELVSERGANGPLEPCSGLYAGLSTVRAVVFEVKEAKGDILISRMSVVASESAT